MEALACGLDRFGGLAEAACLGARPSVAYSCDPDPAGFQIALTAGALWDDAGIPWQTRHMNSDTWRSGITLPLNDYDRRVLGETQAHTGLSSDLAMSRDYLLASGRKAEQEGW